MNGAPTITPAERSRLKIALERAGAVGITSKQLARILPLPESKISRSLEVLLSEHKVDRFGRGLWVLPRFQSAQRNGGGSLDAASYRRKFERAYGIIHGPYPFDLRFNPNEKRAIHRWWPYVQGFSAEFVERECRRSRIGPGSAVLDPFCGSGTALVTARLLGAKTTGIDRMPIAAFVATAKNEWNVDAEELWVQATKVLRAARRSPMAELPFLRRTTQQFRPSYLRALRRLKRAVWAEPEGPAQTLLKLSFSGILIPASKLKRAPCLGYRYHSGSQGTPPFRLFSESVRAIVTDLHALDSERDKLGPRPDVICGDAGIFPLPSESFDLAITSPPYVNGMDYVMNYKIDMAWMDMVRSYRELAELKGAMVACDNISPTITSLYEPSDVVVKDEWIAGVTAGISQNIQRRSTYRRLDMARIVSKYFDDLLPVIRNVFQSLRPGGRFAVVNGDSLMAGTYVPGDMIFARLAERCGFQVESFEVARSRRSGQRRSFQLRESVLRLRKPLSS